MIFAPLVTSDVFRVGMHESVAVWGLTPAAVSSQHHQDGAYACSAGNSNGHGDFEASPTGLAQQPEQRSMLERLNDGDDDDVSDSTESSGEDNELEITCKRGSGGSPHPPHVRVCMQTESLYCTGMPPINGMCVMRYMHAFGFVVRLACYS